MKIKLLSLVLITTFALTACNKSSKDPKPGNTGSTGSTGTTGTIGSTGVDVYTISSNPVTLWKNDTEVPFQVVGYEYKSVITSGKDVYVTGCTVSGSKRIAGYWKNGTLVNLADNNNDSEAISIAVQGNDVYVVGVFNNKPAYWKNGKLSILPYNGTEAYTSGIAINGNDVYICGYFDTSNNTNSRIGPCYWKNGVFTSMDGDFYLSVPYAIAINGNDVYIVGFANGTYNPLAGSTFDSAVCWKNGIAQKLATTKNESAAEGIAISNGDIYICGSISTDIGQGTFSAVYWKNGTINIVQDQAAAYGIAVHDSDVYICGAYFVPAGPNSVPAGPYFNYYPSWWKNGVITKVDNQTLIGTINGIALAAK